MDQRQLSGLEGKLLTHIETLESFGSRYYAVEGNRAAQAYIEACLQEYGYRVERSMSFYEGASFASPWAIKAGGLGADGALVLLAAHYDSISQDPNGAILAEAPGADDNASGVAVLLETARALAAVDLKQGVGFVFFNVEEVGQHGSKQFAKDWKEQGRRLDGVINIDTIGTWPIPLSQGGQVNYVANALSQPFMDRIRRDLAVPLKAAATPWEDDHASFWAEGVPAVELTEEGCTPAMHSPQDTSEKIDIQSVARVTLALVEMLSKAF
jgi:Zn-dependent M28 family amino/carboxypeptidase